MEPLFKSFSGVAPAEFEGLSRFDDKTMSEWHIISTNEPDHTNDIMEYDGMELPPAGKGIALLNHDPFWTGGLPLGIVLEYRRVKPGEIEQLWQHTQYLKTLPDDIGTLTYQSRKQGAFTDSSIQFKTSEGGAVPMREEDNGKSQGEWKGTRYKKWSLLEAGPVLIGMNWHTGDMKSASDISIVKSNIVSMLKRASSGEPIIRILPEQRLRFITDSDR